MQRPNELARRGELGGPEISAHRDDVRGNQIGFPPITENWDEIGKHTVDRLYDPGEIEYREKSGDLERGPAVNLFQIKTQRLSDQSADLTDAFHQVDQREEQQ